MYNMRRSAFRQAAAKPEHNGMLLLCSGKSFCLFMIFILDTRHGGTIQANGSVPFSWESHPSAVLAEPSPLLESEAGRKYHYPPMFHCLSESCSDSEADIARSLFQGHGVLLLWLPRCQPAIGLMYLCCCYSVFKIQ